jgi:hypothetical protein
LDIDIEVEETEVDPLDLDFSGKPYEEIPDPSEEEEKENTVDSSTEYNPNPVTPSTPAVKTAEKKQSNRGRTKMTLTEAQAKTYTVHGYEGGTYQLSIPKPIGLLIDGKTFRYEIAEDCIKLVPVEEVQHVDEINLPTWLS